MAPLISFSGIASGIDSQSLIKSLLDRDRAVRITPLNKQITNLTETNDSFSKLKGLLGKLQSAADKFRTLNGGVISRSATSSDETVTTASASNIAQTGTTSISVSSLAKNATYSFQSSAGAYSSANSKISDGSAFSDTLTIKLGTPSDPAETIALSVNENTTLTDVVNSFNSQSTKAVASLVNAGTDANPDYRLVINTNKTGTAEGQITVDVGTTLSGRNAFNNNTSDNAADAEFTITGISGTIKRSSNTVSDIIPGITFNLKSIGSANVSVGISSSQSTSNIQAFADAFNEVVKYISENDAITQESDGKNTINIFGPLKATSLDQNVLSTIRSAFSSSSKSGGAVNTLSDLGLSTQRDGTLSFDSSVFAAALNSEPNSVQQITQSLGDTLSGVGGRIAQFTQYSGLFDQTTKSNTTRITELNNKISEIEKSLSKQEEILQSRFGRLEGLIGQLNSQQNALSSLLPR